MVRVESRLLAVGTLVEIFYSLAIVSGIEHVADVLLATGAQGFSVARLAAGCGALMLALGDWAVYHVFVAHLGYRRILRVVLDLLIIVAVFLAFRCIEDPTQYSVAVLAYLLLGGSYMFLLCAEHPLPPKATQLCILQFGLAVLCSLVLVAFEGARLSGNEATEAVAGLCMIWGVINLSVANAGLAMAERAES